MLPSYNNMDELEDKINRYENNENLYQGLVSTYQPEIKQIQPKPKHETFTVASEHINQIGRQIPKQIGPERANTQIAEDVVMIVHYDSTQHKFSLYDHNKTLLGTFFIAELMNYASNDPLFGKLEGEVSKGVIETYICKKIDGVIKILTHLESPFMGNINALIKLDEALVEYQRTSLNTSLSLVQEQNRKIVRSEIMTFINNILNHIVQIVSLVINEASKQPAKKQVKDQLLRYGISLSQRITTLAQTQFKEKITEIEQIDTKLMGFEEANKELTNKMNVLINKLDIQTLKIKKLVKQVKRASADDSDSDSESSSDDDDDGYDDNLVEKLPSDHGEIINENTAKQPKLGKLNISEVLKPVEVPKQEPKPATKPATK